MAIPARNNGDQNIAYLRKKVTYLDGAAGVVEVGTLPIGAIVLRAGVVVTTAFNAASTNVLDIGTTADPDGLVVDAAMGTIGVIISTTPATSNDVGPYTADTSIIATHAQTGTLATAGEGYVWVEYMPVA